MNQTTQEIVIPVDPLQELACTLYQKVGVSREHAQIMAKLQVETDLRGVHSHGTRALPRYVRGLLDGQLNPRPQIRVVREAPALVVLDGDNGLGHPVCVTAMRIAIEKAKSTGIAAAGVCHAGHFGAAACYSVMATEQNMIGFATTNTGRASVVAPGGTTPVTANNAMSYALPTGRRHPIVLDMACAVASWGKVDTMHMYGIPIPEGWLLTQEGNPTTDRRKGRMLQPAAGPRGYGLALVMGVLAGPLVGGRLACHKQVGDPSEHFFIAINVSSFTDFDDYVEELQKGIRTIHASPTVDGVEQVYLPGEIEWNKRDEWVKSGIPLHVDHLKALEQIASEVGVDVFWK